MDSQQCMAILKAAKALNGSNPDQVNNANLVTILIRGGLWDITAPALQIFEVVEKTFKEEIKTSEEKNVIHIHQISQKLHNDLDIICNVNAIVADAEIPCNSESLVSGFLMSVINLYVRVRAFSHAKSLMEKFKIKKGIAKAKALPTEIKRSTEPSAVRDRPYLNFCNSLYLINIIVE